MNLLTTLISIGALIGGLTGQTIMDGPNRGLLDNIFGGIFGSGGSPQQQQQFGGVPFGASPYPPGFGLGPPGPQIATAGFNQQAGLYQQQQQPMFNSPFGPSFYGQMPGQPGGSPFQGINQPGFSQPGLMQGFGFGSPFGAGPGGIGGPTGQFGPGGPSGQFGPGGPSGQFGPGGFGSPFLGQNFVGQQYGAGAFGGPQMSPFGQQQSPFGMGAFGPSRPFRSISDGRPVVFEQDDD